MNREEFDRAFAGLTDRRREVLAKVLAEETNETISKSLNIVPATVRKHIEGICDRFGIPKGTSVARPSRRNQLIRLFAKYKPDLLPGDIPEIPHLPKVKVNVEETTSRNYDSLSVEGAIANFPSEDIEALVQKVRSHFQTTIQDECATLCTFNLLYTPTQGNLSRMYVQTELYETQGFGCGEFSQERQLWNQVVLKHPKLMVLGKPGAGKTTLLQYIALHYDEIEFQPNLVPVFISLKTLAENAKYTNRIQILDYIHENCCHRNVSKEVIQTLLRCGRMLFFFDGLDEVIENQVAAVNEEINNLIKPYSSNRFIVSCRKEFQMKRLII